MTIPPMIATIVPAFIKSFLSTTPVLTSKALLGVPKTVQNASDAANPTDRTVILGFILRRRAILKATGVKIATTAVLLNKFVTKIVTKVIRIISKNIGIPPKGFIRKSAIHAAAPDTKKALPNAIPAPKSK